MDINFLGFFLKYSSHPMIAFFFFYSPGRVEHQSFYDFIIINIYVQFFLI